MLEGDLQIVLQIGAALPLPAPAPGTRAEKVGEDVPEDVAETAETGGLAAAHPFRDMTELIVLRPFDPVAEHRVGLGGILELLLGGGVSGISVRMVFQRDLAVGLLDFVFRGTAGNAQGLVVIRCRQSIDSSCPVCPVAVRFGGEA